MPKVINLRTIGSNPNKLPPNTIYIGRPGKWGNPYQIGFSGTRKEVVQMYREDIEDAIADNPHYLDELKGKDLACWCHEWDGIGPNPGYCHGDILLELANA